MNQLKALERKRQVEITKLQEGNNRQENVLRRKNEEISRIQRQLRDTSEKHKLVQEKRQQAFDRKESSFQFEKLRNLVTQEIDLSACIQESQVNLNKLINERREAAAELEALKAEFDSLNGDETLGTSYSAKRSKINYNMDSTYVSGKEEESENNKAGKQELEKKIKRIEDDIECKNVQINEIQQMVIESDGRL